MQTRWFGLLPVFLLPVCILSVFFSGSVYAVDKADKSSVTTGSAALNVISGLLLVTALIFSLAWVVKRLGGGTFIQNNHMKIVASLAVGTREKLVLVEIDNKKVLLGVTPNAISQLYISEAEQHIAMPESEHFEADDNTSSKTVDFAQFLKKIIKDGSKT